MRSSITAIAILMTGLLPLELQAGWQETDPAVAALIDSWIDSRQETTPQPAAPLLKKLAGFGLTEIQDLEKALQAPRASYPDLSGLQGKVSKHEVPCRHVDYESTFLMQVPAAVPSGQELPLVVIGHGGNSSMSPRRAEATARMYLRAYAPLGEKMNAILIAPVSTRGWGHIGNSLIFSSISKVQRLFPVDPDRIYITGQSMGGHLSYRAALSLPDRWGAVSPHSGGYDFVERETIGNLLNVPGYAIWGVREPYGINKDNRTNAGWAASHPLEWKFVEKDGGHEIYQDELANVADFFLQHPRDLYRDQVYLRAGGAMKFIKTWEIEGWPEHTVYSDTRPLRWNLRHWLQVEPRPDLQEPLSILAARLGNNRFEVVSDNVRDFSIFVHSGTVNMDRAISVRVNGEELFYGKVQPDPQLMFDLVREFDDRGRIFHGRIDIRVETDREVKIRETD